MSLNFTQIQALIDRNCKTDSTRYTVANKTTDVNLELDETLALIFDAGGTWQFDDSNHGDYPIIYTDLVLNQRDYSFTTDEQGNLILDIYKVLIKNEAGIYVEIQPVDVQSDKDMAGFYDGQELTGVPTRYDKTANGIFLDRVPSYNSSSGLKIYINRESSYFLTSDTTKKPGFAGLYHEVLAIGASIRYFLRNKMFDLAGEFQKGKDKMQFSIRRHYGKRERDTVRRLNPNVESTR